MPLVSARCAALASLSLFVSGCASSSRACTSPAVVLECSVKAASSTKPKGPAVGVTGAFSWGRAAWGTARQLNAAARKSFLPGVLPIGMPNRATFNCSETALMFEESTRETLSWIAGLLVAAAITSRTPSTWSITLSPSTIDRAVGEQRRPRSTTGYRREVKTASRCAFERLDEKAGQAIKAAPVPNAWGPDMRLCHTRRAEESGFTRNAVAKKVAAD